MALAGRLFAGLSFLWSTSWSYSFDLQEPRRDVDEGTALFRVQEAQEGIGHRELERGKYARKRRVGRVGRVDGS